MNERNPSVEERPRCATEIHTLRVFENPDKTQWVQAVKMAPQCGCTIEGGGTCQQPLRIAYCPTHAGALALLSALTAADQRLRELEPDWAASDEIRKCAEALKATGGAA